MITKFDFIKSWDELTNAEQWDFEEECKTNAIKNTKKLCKKCNVEFNPIMVQWDAKEAWYFKHMKAKQDAYIEVCRTQEEKAYIEACNAEKRLKNELRKAKKELDKLIN